MGPALDFMRSLWQMNHALERVSRWMEVSSGITGPQRMVLLCIGRFPGITASQLAAQLHVDAGTVSSALRRLERKGFIERRRSEKDRRRMTLGLTAQGRAVDRAVGGTVEQAVETLLASENAGHVQSTRRVLAALTELLEAKADRPPPR